MFRRQRGGSNAGPSSQPQIKPQEVPAVRPQETPEDGPVETPAIRPEEEKMPVTVSYLCRVCGQRFATKDELKKHFEKEHPVT